MANFDLSAERIAASQLNQRGEEELFAPVQDVWGETWSQKQNEDGLCLGMGSKEDRSRGLTSSAISSNLSRHSSRSSRDSNTHFPASTEVVQATLPSLRLRPMNLYSSLRSHQRPFKLENEDVDWEILQPPPAMSNMEAETQQPHSPPSAFPLFVADSSVYQRVTPAGPLDKFLEQKDELRNLGGDLKRLQQDQERVRISRVDGLRLRTQLRDKRKELRRKRLAKSSADDAFMKHMREHRSGLLQLLFPVTQSSKDTTIDELYEAMQTARDEYGEAEFAYNQLEDLVDDHEFNLAKMEGRLYNTDMYDVPYPPPTSESYPPAPESLLGLSSDATNEYHQFHINYLTRLGDLDLARERYHNMIEERDNLVSLQESRAPLGIEIHESGKEFLENFPSREAALLGQMVEIEEDIERWRERCLAEGIELSDEDNELSVEGNETHHGSQAESESPRHWGLVHDIPPTHSSSFQPSMFPILLPESDEDKGKLGVLITDFDEGNKSDRINRWIRYQLQTSPSEVELLARVFLHFLRILDFSQWDIDLYEWQLSVLSWWPRDEANKLPQDFNSARTHSSAAHSSTPLKPRGRSFSKFVMKGVSTDHDDSISHRRTRSEPVSANMWTIFDGCIFSQAIEM